MQKTEFSRLMGAKHGRTKEAENLQAKLSENKAQIRQASTDKQAALRSKDQGAGHTAQFTVESLQLENSDLEEKIQELKATRPSKAETDAAWKADLIENPDYLAELAMFRTAAALFDAVCVRAKREYGEWTGFAYALSELLTGSSFPPQYIAPDPSGQLNAGGWVYASKGMFDPATHRAHTFDPAGVDRLVELLQQIKADGVKSIF